MEDVKVIYDLETQFNPTTLKIEPITLQYTFIGKDDILDEIVKEYQERNIQTRAGYITGL